MHPRGDQTTLVEFFGPVVRNKPYPLGTKAFSPNHQIFRDIELVLMLKYRRP